MDSGVARQEERERERENTDQKLAEHLTKTQPAGRCCTLAASAPRVAGEPAADQRGLSCKPKVFAPTSESWHVSQSVPLNLWW